MVENEEDEKNMESTDGRGFQGNLPTYPHLTQYTRV